MIATMSIEVWKQKTPTKWPGFFWFFSCGESRKPRLPDGLQAAFKDGRWLEADRLGCGDLHGFPGFRVATLAGGPLFDFESSETNDLDFLVLLHTFGDGRKNGFEGFVGSTLGRVFSEGSLDGFNQFSFVHGSDVSENASVGWQEKIR